ncbi:uncharacterized protein LOC17887894 isoform X3 [Capsella rubella]|uniref:uncharacterized protein LOC17887894 isoform X3 n=1 Tax=Capsella rubella TaxID=81985 RepID=UPI000CD56C0A|nr:uncharacterized protein LOC17887894 isoform X3 [Capsella rubella]
MEELLDDHEPQGAMFSFDTEDVDYDKLYQDHPVCNQNCCHSMAHNWRPSHQGHPAPGIDPTSSVPVEDASNSVFIDEAIITAIGKRNTGPALRINPASGASNSVFIDEVIITAIGNRNTGPALRINPASATASTSVITSNQTPNAASDSEILDEANMIANQPRNTGPAMRINPVSATASTSVITANQTPNAASDSEVLDEANMIANITRNTGPAMGTFLTSAAPSEVHGLVDVMKGTMLRYEENEFEKKRQQQRDHAKALREARDKKRLALLLKKQGKGK